MRVNGDYILEAFGVCLVPQIPISKFPILDNGESGWGGGLGDRSGSSLTTFQSKSQHEVTTSKRLRVYGARNRAKVGEMEPNRKSRGQTLSHWTKSALLGSIKHRFVGVVGCHSQNSSGRISSLR